MWYQVVSLGICIGLCTSKHAISMGLHCTEAKNLHAHVGHRIHVTQPKNFRTNTPCFNKNLKTLTF